MAAKNQYHLTFKDYLKIARQRSSLLFAFFAIGILVTLTAALVLPSVFVSTGTILVESPKIPSALIPASVTASVEERVQIIRQRIMTHSNLLQIANKYRLYSQNRDKLKDSAIVDKVRQSTSIAPIYAGLGGHRGGTVAFEVAFEDPSADVAQGVANELVTLFLSENAKVRTEHATETTAFLNSEADKLQAELAKREASLAAYKQRYANALPEHLEMRMGMLQRAEADLRNVKRDFSTTEQELRFLGIELSSARAGYGVKAPLSVDEGNLSLEELQTEYELLGHRLTPRHPDMRALLRRIESMDQTAGASAGFTGAPFSELDVRVAKIQTQVDAVEARQASLRGQEEQLRSRISEIEERIFETPQVQRALTGIMRDYTNARAKYEEVRAKQTDAAISESLEAQNKAEHFSLLEPPPRPDTPAKPDRKKILLGGFFFAFASTGGLIVLFGVSNSKVQGAGGLTHVMRQPPLAVIPYISTPADFRRRRAKMFEMLGLSASFLVAAATLVHFFYMPLDRILIGFLA